MLQEMSTSYSPVEVSQSMQKKEFTLVSQQSFEPQVSLPCADQSRLCQPMKFLTGLEFVSCISSEMRQCLKEEKSSSFVAKIYLRNFNTVKKNTT